MTSSESSSDFEADDQFGTSLDDEPVDLTNRPTTLRTFQRFQDEGFDLPVRQYVGLCAYLCVLLRWGYQVEVSHLDSFITYYPTYLAWLPMLERRQYETCEVSIPSYHNWFQAEIEEERSATEASSALVSTTRHDLTNEEEDIIGEIELRTMWAENPFIFLRTEVTMESLASLALAQVRQAQMHAVFR